MSWKSLTATNLLLLTTVTEAARLPLNPALPLRRRQVIPTPWYNVTCGAVGDPGSNPYSAWQTAFADSAYEAVSNSWNNDAPPAGDTTPLDYVETFMHFFNGPRNWNCSNIAQGDPCAGGLDHCGDNEGTSGAANVPAAYLIGDSFTNLHNVHSSRYQAISNAQQFIDISSLQSTFAPVDIDALEILKTILDSVQLVIGLGSAYTWNLVLKSAPIFNVGSLGKDVLQQIHGGAKDAFNNAISTIFTTTKDNLQSDDTALNEQNDLSSALTQLVGIWQASEATFLSYIFSGAGNALSDLHNLIQNGFFIPTPQDGLADFQNQAIKILYGILIPKAWGLISGAKPFILMVDGDCGSSSTAPDSAKAYMSDDTAAQTHICFDNKIFYLVNGVKNPPAGGSCDPTSRDCFGPTGSETVSFNSLPGGTFNNLNGNNWYGIKLDDFIISSYQGYQLNGNQNGYQMPDLTTYIDGQGTQGDIIFQNQLQTPGLFTITICTDADSAANNVKGGKAPC
ncbi:hypothetical protein NA57DRAFT_51937 [Rhizodiscina lignyota]|uniref:Uncharacterized protein n=1 Tax=Rhizodiscina lignyota TaxID=1504668 RepID=A0A9P4M940_9PEZI|nr:hypothetical protein NA57DRAFT_51937 [Rhizodiscina lignyota]